jgi:glutathione S-transferase
MKLYIDTLAAPNPRKVRLFIAEKRLELECVRISMKDRHHKTPEFLKLNSLGQLPVLVTDEGTRISESLAICRYLDALHPDPPLFGRNPIEMALVEMWIRRAEFRLWEATRVVWRNDDERTEHLVKTRFRDHGVFSREVVREAMLWIDSELSDERRFLAGDGFSMADIVMLCGVDFAAYVRMEMPLDAAFLTAWHRRVCDHLSIP